MYNTELTLDQLTNVSGAEYRPDFCIDPLILKFILSGQKVPTKLKESLWIVVRNIKDSNGDDCQLKLSSQSRMVYFLISKKLKPLDFQYSLQPHSHSIGNTVN